MGRAKPAMAPKFPGERIAVAPDCTISRTAFPFLSLYSKDATWFDGI